MMASEQENWSVMKYDLKTALDVLHLPCWIKCPDSNFHDLIPEKSNAKTQSGYVTKLAKEMCVCYARARVLELPDTDVYMRSKGPEFVRRRTQFIGSEILIPIEYGGRVRLYDREGGKQYYTIREVAEHFPRYVQVEKDDIGVIPNTSVIAVVRKGTVLEIDRITMSAQSSRCFRESYLICFDRQNNREIAFKLTAPVHFRKLSDLTESLLKNFVEDLSLPQTIEFLDVNPYDIICIDDNDACDLMVQLTGPVELLDLKIETFIVGKIQLSSDHCDIVAFPSRAECTEKTLVFLPATFNSENNIAINGSTLFGDIVQYEVLLQKLYMYRINDDRPLLVRNTGSQSTTYAIEQNPDTPPLLPKLDNWTRKESVFLSSSSLDDIEIKEKSSALSKRRHSTSGMDCTRHERETQEMKSYWTKLSKQVQSTASQILFRLGKLSYSMAGNLRGKACANETQKCASGFICYLNMSNINYPLLVSLVDAHERERPAKSNVCAEQRNSYMSNGRKMDRCNGTDIYSLVNNSKRQSSLLRPDCGCPICLENGITLSVA